MEKQVKHSPYWHYIAKGRVRDGGQNSAVSVQVLFGVTYVFLSSLHAAQARLLHLADAISFLPFNKTYSSSSEQKQRWSFDISAAEILKLYSY